MSDLSTLQAVLIIVVPGVTIPIIVCLILWNSTYYKKKKIVPEKSLKERYDDYLHRKNRETLDRDKLKLDRKVANDKLCQEIIEIVKERTGTTLTVKDACYENYFIFFLGNIGLHKPLIIKFKPDSDIFHSYVLPEVNVYIENLIEAVEKIKTKSS
jgi:hypothetical protein